MKIKLPGACSSPIAPLFRDLEAAVRNVGGPRASQLTKLIEDVTLEVISADRWICHYDSSCKTIHLSTRALEVMWCCGFAYMQIFEDYRQARVRDMPLHKTTTLDLTATQTRRDAVMLLTWAMTAWNDPTQPSWPNPTIKPSMTPTKGTPENVADEICLAAVAYLLHHELAHHYMGHTPKPAGPDSIDQERDADYAAAEAILADRKETEGVFIARSVAIAVAMGTRTAFGIHDGYHGGVSHPRDFDRLINTLDRYVSDDYHIAWGISQFMLKLHLESRRITIPAEIYPSFRACVDRYAELLAAGAAAKP